MVFEPGVADDLGNAFVGLKGRAQPEARKKCRHLYPVSPPFKRFLEGEAPPVHNWRLTELRTDLDHLQFGLTKQDRESALGSILSALRNVRILGRKEV
jgi:hypothetical protein